MKNSVLSIIYLLIIVSCKKTNNQPKKLNNTENKDSIITSVTQKETEEYIYPVIDSSALGINFKPEGNYQNILSKIKQQRIQFKVAYQVDPDKTLDSISHFFTNTLLNDIVPHWYGTTWDFEGHTNQPNNGEIACGYFVSTTLKHFGFNLNRYKLAQQGGTNEALSLQPFKKLSTYRNIEYPELKSKLLNKYKDGLYFVGLSNHVGYILIKNKELYFLHSSYCDNKVVIELAEYAACFMSDIYVIAELSSNKWLLKNGCLMT